jgi:hypothetical protein
VGGPVRGLANSSGNACWLRQSSLIPPPHPSPTPPSHPPTPPPLLGCPGHSPAIPASYRGSTMFLYHAKAIEAWRTQALAPWFVEYARQQGKSLDQAAFLAALTSMQAKDLAATLTNLAPANALPLWAVKVQV